MTTERIDIGKILADVGMPETSEDINRIDPKVMTAIMAMAQAGQLVKIRKIQEDAQGQGWLRGIVFQVTDTQIPYDGYRLDYAATGIYLHNDGPAMVYVGLNNNLNPSILGFNETLNLEYNSHKLVLIFLKCDTGLTATVRASVKG
jgi:hypothetical protein